MNRNERSGLRGCRSLSGNRSEEMGWIGIDRDGCFSVSYVILSRLRNMKNQIVKFPSAGTRFQSAGATFQGAGTCWNPSFTSCKWHLEPKKIVGWPSAGRQLAAGWPPAGRKIFTAPENIFRGARKYFSRLRKIFFATPENIFRHAGKYFSSRRKIFFVAPENIFRG